MRTLWLRSSLAAVLGLAFLTPAFADSPDPAKPNEKEKALSAAELAARIDAHIAAKWKAGSVTPAPLAEDAEFLRRAYLDVVGRIPRVSELRKFLNDKSPDKRQKKINELLESHGYVNHFTDVWVDRMLPQGNNQFARAFGSQMEQWVKGRLGQNARYDEMVRELLTADPVAGRGVRVGPGGRQIIDPFARSVIAFYQANQMKPENLAASTSRLFLGVKLECAQCHDHPFASWSREQFWEYTAFFAGIRPRQQQGRQVRPAGYDPAAHEIQIPGTEKTVQAKFLDGKEPKWGDPINARETLAKWMTAKDNPFFARAAANYLWAHFFGYGIIDPVDEPTADNPPSHPELLDELARQFVLNDYDLKYLVRAITFSKAYQLSSRQTHATQADPRLFARMSVKGLTPEQLFESLKLATGYREPNTRARGFNSRFFGPRAEFRNTFGNSADRRTEFQTSILQALTLMNGQFTSDATSIAKSETLAAVIDSPFMNTRERLDALYLAALSRPMHDAEASRMVRYVEQGGPSRDHAKALADVFWMLLNSSEFILNH